MIRSLARLTWRLERFELATVLIASVLLSIGGLVVALVLNGLGGPACDAGLATCGSDETFGLVNVAFAGPFMAIMAVFPFAAGTVLGVPIVGAELERGTAAVAWSLAPSRLRWLARRAIPVALVLVISVTLVALVADGLEKARAPLFNPTTSFLDYGLRGPLVVAKGMAAFGIALLAGAASGRILSGIIATAIASLLLVNVLGFAMVRWLPVEEVGGGRCVATCIAATEAVRTPDGRFLTLAQAARDAPSGPPPPGGPASEAMRSWMMANGYSEVTVAISGEQMPHIEVRELFVLCGVTAVSGFAAAAVTARRRPQ